MDSDCAQIIDADDKKSSKATVTRFQLCKYAKKEDRKSTRLNSSHSQISYAVFCLKKKKTDELAVAAQRLESHWCESTIRICHHHPLFVQTGLKLPVPVASCLLSETAAEHSVYPL